MRKLLMFLGIVVLVFCVGCSTFRAHLDELSGVDVEISRMESV